MICLQCGDCCTRFEIIELDKPAGVRCKHLTNDNKCSIYNTRPEVCMKHDYPFTICPIGKGNQNKEPTGKCKNCGGVIFNGSEFCCDTCYSLFAKSCMSYRWQ